MIALRRKVNFAFTVLTAQPSSETVGVRLHGGDLRYVTWGGFRDRRDIEEDKVRFVKLDVYEYTATFDAAPQWVRLHKNAYIRGCLVPYKNASGYLAYAVTIDGELLVGN